MRSKDVKHWKRETIVTKTYPQLSSAFTIGIMASLDPVALDRASLDQIYLSDDPGKDELVERIESLDGAFTLDYAEELGLGSQTYELVLV